VSAARLAIDAPRSALRARGFNVRLAAIAAAALLARLVYVLVFTRALHGSGDSEFFHRLGDLIGAGRGFINPIGLSLTGRVTPTALHPPLYPLVLGGAASVGLKSYLAERVIGCVIGAIGVAAVGVLGREVAGERAGLIAAALAAVYPTLIAADGAVMSESLYGLLVVLTLIAAYSLARQPTPLRGVALGAAIALAALTRAEALTLLLLAALPAALLARRGARGGPLRSPVGALAAAVATCVLVLIPWTVHTWTAFGRPILISNNSGTLVSGANCRATYHGRLLGSWNIFCVSPGRSTNEAVAAAHERAAGLRYALDHPGRLPVVLAARLGRTFDLYQPVAEARHAEGRAFGVELAGMIAFYVLALAAVQGARVLRRRREPVVLLAGPIVLAALVSITGYGVPRFREPADLAIVVLAAVAVDAFARERSPDRAVSSSAAR